MEIGAPQQYGWAANTSLGCDSVWPNHQQQAWTTSNGGTDHTLSVTPRFLTQTLVEQNDQFNVYEEVFSHEILQSSTRGASIPIEQLENEVLWPEQRSNNPNELRREPHPYQSPQQLNFSRRCGNRGNNIETDDGVPHLATNIEPPKRKRGRPRLCSPMTDHDAHLSHLSSNRKSHLEKNRIAANKCRQRKKESSAELKAKASELTAKNTALKSDVASLREEVLNLKNEVLRHARCGSWAIDRYVARSASDMLGEKTPSPPTTARKDSSQSSISTVSTNVTEELSLESNIESEPKRRSTGVEVDLNDQDLLWLLSDDTVDNE